LIERCCCAVMFQESRHVLRLFPPETFIRG
jgi:hypothetical protein